jgi:hypothetical protein
VALNGQIRQGIIGVGQPPPATGGADAFFDDNYLHDVFLTINSKDWQTLKDNYLDNTYYPADFRWRDQTIRNSGIRSRGTGSRSGVKPGLRIDFDRYVSGQTFLSEKSFVLRNNTQDASGMHERLSMQLFRRLGLLAPRESHTKVYINNEYAGLFTIVESIDKKFLQANVGEDTGYLFKYDYAVNAAPYYFEDRGTRPESYVPAPFKPETHEADARPEVVVSLVQAINQTPDASFKSVMSGYLDLGKFVRHVAVEQFVGDLDGFVSSYGGMNNFYFYRFDNRNLFTVIGWDKSEAFKGGTNADIFRGITGVPDSQKNRLLTRVLSFSDLKTAFLDALLECVRSSNEVVAGSADRRGWLEREVEREYRQIRDAERADPLKSFSNDEFEQEVRNLTAFAQGRGAVVTSQVAAAR